MGKEQACPECGRRLPEGALEGVCPVCSLRGALHCASPIDPGASAPPSGVGSPSPPQAPLLTRFGDYELLELLARGGMGVVYKARQISLNRTVALKTIQAGVLASPAEVKRFRTEAEAIAQFHHPNIVAVYEIGEHEGQHYFSMDYVAGRTLAEIVRDGPLAATRAASYVKTMAAAMHYAHQHGILHRDLKPANIIIDENDQPRITDFGLAKRFFRTMDHAPPTTDLTLSGQVLGSPNYLPPEQAEPKRGTPGPPSDVYALGAILYHLVTGRPPFQAESLTTLLRQVVEADPVPPRSLNPSIPHDLETTCLKCLAKEPRHRYATAQSLADDLARFLNHEPVLARPVGAGGRAWRWCRRQPVRAGLIGALMLAVASGTGAVLWQWRQAQAARVRAESAERSLTEQLWSSYLAEARANRWSGRAGRRFNSLEALSKAAAIRPALDLRNEAIACLALADVRIQSRFPLSSQGTNLICAIDDQFERYAMLLDDSSIYIRRLSDHQELMHLPGFGRVVFGGLIFSRDGQWLAARSQSEETGRFALYDLARGKLAFSVAGFYGDLEFSPAGNWVAAAEGNGTIRFYDTNTGEAVAQLSVVPPLNKIAYDRAGKRLAVSRAESPSVCVVDLDTKAITAAFDGIGSVRDIAWSLDDAVLACPADDNRVYLWHIASGERKILEGHTSTPMGVLYNHAGDIIISTGWDGTTWFWDAHLAVPLVSINGGYALPGFSPDDRRLGFGINAEQIGIWQFEPGRECRQLGRMEPLYAAQYSPDGQVLATASDDGVRLWNGHSNRLLKHLPLAAARSVIWTSDGTKLLAAGWPGVKGWALDALNSPREGPPEATQLLASRRSETAALSPDGRTLIVAATDGADLVALDLLESGLPRRLSGHSAAAHVCIHPKGKWFATGTWHGQDVKVWSTETWQPIRVLPAPGSAKSAFSHDGNWLVTGYAKAYDLWSTEDWKRVVTIPRDQVADTPGNMAFSPDGRILALLHGTHRPIKLVSIPQFKEMATLDTGTPLCFSPNGAKLVTTSLDQRSLLVWDLGLIRQELRAMKLDWE